MFGFRARSWSVGVEGLFAIRFQDPVFRQLLAGALFVRSFCPLPKAKASGRQSLGLVQGDIICISLYMYFFAISYVFGLGACGSGLRGWGVASMGSA